MVTFCVGNLWTHIFWFYIRHVSYSTRLYSIKYNIRTDFSVMWIMYIWYPLSKFFQSPMYIWYTYQCIFGTHYLSSSNLLLTYNYQHSIFFALYNLHILGLTYEWDHILFVFVCLAYLTQCNVLEFIHAVTCCHHPFLWLFIAKNNYYYKSNFDGTL